MGLLEPLKCYVAYIFPLLTTGPYHDSVYFLLSIYDSGIILLLCLFPDSTTKMNGWKGWDSIVFTAVFQTLE